MIRAPIRALIRKAFALPCSALMHGLTWTVVWAVLAGGCGATSKSVEPLNTGVSVYNDGLRWQRFQQAASRLPSDERDDFLDERDQIHEDLRIHHYEVIRVRYGPENQRARVQVKYTWFLESRGVVHETHAVQRWQRDEVFWVMIGESLLRGESMPGLPETEPDEPEPDLDVEPADTDSLDTGAQHLRSPEHRSIPTGDVAQCSPYSNTLRFCALPLRASIP